MPLTVSGSTLPEIKPGDGILVTCDCTDDEMRRSHFPTPDQLQQRVTSARNLSILDRRTNREGVAEYTVGLPDAKLEHQHVVRVSFGPCQEGAWCKHALRVLQDICPGAVFVAGRGFIRVDGRIWLVIPQ